MGKKEKILELIKENDGLTYNKLITKYNEKYNTNPNNPDTIKRKSAYVYLKRLRKERLIENDKGMNVYYKPTPKAYLTKEEQKELEKPLQKALKRKIYQEFIDKDIKIFLTKEEAEYLEKDITEMLEEYVN